MANETVARHKNALGAVFGYDIDFLQNRYKSHGHDARLFHIIMGQAVTRFLNPNWVAYEDEIIEDLDFLEVFDSLIMEG